MSNTVTETTKKDFDIFKKETNKWIEIFGLKSWDIDIVHESNQEMPDALGWCRFNVLSRHAQIGLSKDWIIKVNNKNVKKTAFHEVTELFFARINVLAGERYIGESEVGEAMHELVRTLENILWVKY